VPVRRAGGDVAVRVTAPRPADVTRATLRGFAEGAGYVSIEPEHYTNKVDRGDHQWTRIEDYGRTLSGMRADAPVDAAPETPGNGAPCLEYRMYLFTPGSLSTALILAPTLNIFPGRDLRVAVSFDDQAPEMVTIVPAKYTAAGRDWETSVKDNARTVTSTHTLATAGYHTLKVWMVDPAVVVQKIVVTTAGGGNRTSYLGPPESYHR
jgi:hypothetical protein